MEPLNEDELNQLLRQWEAPAAPASLTARVFAGKQSAWRWLFTGTIRVPVPLALAAAILVALWIHYSAPAGSPRVAHPSTVSLADFQPVRQLEPVVVRGGQR